MLNIIYEYSKVKDKKLKEHIIDTPLLHKYFKLDRKISPRSHLLRWECIHRFLILKSLQPLEHWNEKNTKQAGANKGGYWKVNIINTMEKADD
ncbi:hypothetical protein CVO_02860 [Sulfurimonas sp. CVO]|jgi:hypothetical protein|uniref:Uncharacterized protein n=1 Tax=Sulfurimonas xiamenensis TaxID=2590021 RepID=A0AAJ4DMX0_9BACT|nr:MULTISPECIES: hypothetical protein [Sulfurimonas]PLY14469.1 MAG: hypothetical protein C0628_04175 [Sulfurimonas sp.]QFR43597.1 hypothetical protein FJR47_06605 [Sulfurimonas xiamenensis]QHG90842.1 hypothetical protein CVO_02860 [Sulfurimonas sp. CVO]